MRDAQGFDQFYRETSLRMVRYAYALSGDMGDAQDIVGDAYTKAWRSWKTVAVHPAPEAWVRLTISRLATDRWRRLTSWRSVLTRTGVPEPAPPPSEDAVVLTAALRQLPAHLRQAVSLHYLFDMPVAQIAEETGSPVGTVTSWLHRGRTELAAILTAGRSLEVHDAE